MERGTLLKTKNSKNKNIVNIGTILEREIQFENRCRGKKTPKMSIFSRKIQANIIHKFQAMDQFPVVVHRRREKLQLISWMVSNLPI